jgi:hypothetical protein
MNRRLSDRRPQPYTRTWIERLFTLVLILSLALTALCCYLAWRFLQATLLILSHM